MNRCDYLDPALAWTGVKDTGRGAALSRLGYHTLTRPKSYHLQEALSMGLAGQLELPDRDPLRRRADRRAGRGLQRRPASTRPLFVTDPGARAAADRRRWRWQRSTDAGLEAAVFSEVQPNPTEANVDGRDRGVARRRA